MKKNMIWFVRVSLFSLELWLNILQRCYFIIVLSIFISILGNQCYSGFLHFILISVHEQDDPKVHTVVEKLLDVLNTPSEAVQRAVSACLSPLMQSKHVCR